MDQYIASAFHLIFISPVVSKILIVFITFLVTIISGLTILKKWGNSI